MNVGDFVLLPTESLSGIESYPTAAEAVKALERPNYGGSKWVVLKIAARVGRKTITTVKVEVNETA